MAVVDRSQRQWDAFVARVEISRRRRITSDAITLVVVVGVVACLTVLRPAIRELRYGPTVDGPVVTTVRPWRSGPIAEIRGTLTERSGCLLVAGTPVFWMRGTRWDAAHHTLVSEDGARIPVGARFAGGGGGYDVADVSFAVDPAGAARLARCARVVGTTTVVYAYHAG